jgi:hypothetical protein
MEIYDKIIQGGLDESATFQIATEIATETSEAT